MPEQMWVFYTSFNSSVVRLVERFNQHQFLVAYCFNSSVVRLVVSELVAVPEVLVRFNSSVVRLVAQNFMIYQGVELEFQFQCGAIGSP